MNSLSTKSQLFLQNLEQKQTEIKELANDFLNYVSEIEEERNTFLQEAKKNKRKVKEVKDTFSNPSTPIRSPISQNFLNSPFTQTNKGGKKQRRQKNQKTKKTRK